MLYLTHRSHFRCGVCFLCVVPAAGNEFRADWSDIWRETRTGSGQPAIFGKPPGNGLPEGRSVTESGRIKRATCAQSGADYPTARIAFVASALRPPTLPFFLIVSPGNKIPGYQNLVDG